MDDLWSEILSHWGLIKFPAISIGTIIVIINIIRFVGEWPKVLGQVYQSHAAFFGFLFQVIVFPRTIFELIKYRWVKKGFVIPIFRLVTPFTGVHECFTKSEIETSYDNTSHFGLPDCDDSDNYNDIDEVLKIYGTNTSKDFCSELLTHIPELLHRVEERTKKNNGKLFNGMVVRLESFHIKRNKHSPIPKLQLKFRPTNWFTFAVTNMVIKEKVGDVTIEKILNEEPTLLEGSKRANNMAISINVIVKHNGKLYVLLSERSKENANYPGVWGHTAGGDIDPERDLDEQNRINPLKAIVRELEEEVGHTISDNQVQVLALVIKADQHQPILITQVFVNEPPDNITRNHRSAVASGSWELSGKFKRLSLTPWRVAQFFAFTRPRKLSPTLIADLYFSLIYFYGKNKVEKIFKLWGGIQTAEESAKKII